MRYIKAILPYLPFLLLVVYAAWLGTSLRQVREEARAETVIVSETHAGLLSIGTQIEAAASEPTLTHTPDVDPEQSEFIVLDIPLSEELQAHTYNEAQRIGIDPAILFALMYRESGYKTDAWRIDANGYESVGLCQINGIAFSFLAERGIDPTTPEGNITAACELISYYRDERGCTLLESLAAYGAGYAGMKNGNGFEAASKLIERAKLL